MDTLLSVNVKGKITRNSLTALSVLDILTGHVSTGGAYFFRSTPDIERLVLSLSRTLDIYPNFGGSLVSKENDLFICQDNTGVDFCVVRATTICPDLHDSMAIASRRELLDADITCRAINSGTPLTGFKLIIFSDGSSVLAVSSIHSVGDGATVSEFMKLWSMLYRNEQPLKFEHVPRKIINDLAIGDGYKPSTKFAIIPPLNFDVGKKIAERKEQCGAIHVDIPVMAIRAVTIACQKHSPIPLSSSDVIHAIAWKAFALSTSFSAIETSKLYTVFDLRRVKELHIPAAYEGNALIERSAKMKFGDLRYRELDEIALNYCHQTKPLTPLEIGQDIAFLKREYQNGNVHQKLGKYTNFARSCIIDCLDGTGVYINDMRRLDAGKTTFSDQTFWYETVINVGFNTIFVYQPNDDHVSFRYTGSSSTLSGFADHLKDIVFNDSIDMQRALIQVAYN